MAVAYDAESHITGQAGSTSASYSHTCSGSDRFLIVYTAVSPGIGSISPTSVTYNSVALTKLGSVSGSSSIIDMWYLDNPSTGTNNITVTYAATSAWYSWANSYTGVLSIGNFNSQFKAAGGAGSVTTNFTSSNNNLIASGVFYTASTAPTSDGTDTYSYGSLNGQGGGHKAASASSTSVTWTAGTNAYLHVGAELTLVPTPYTVTANQGSYTLSGQILTLLLRLHFYTLTAVYGVYTLTGQAVTFTRNYFMTVVQGAYTITGLASAFVKKWVNKVKNITSWINKSRT